MKHEGEKKNGGLVGSALVLAACYIVLCLVCFVMIVINDPINWTAYFLDNYTDLRHWRYVLCCLALSFTIIIILRTGNLLRRRTTLHLSFRCS